MSRPPGASICFGWLNEDDDIVNDDGDSDDDDFGDVLHVVCHPESPHALDESGCWTSSFLEEVDLINLITAKQIVCKYNVSCITNQYISLYRNI